MSIFKRLETIVRYLIASPHAGIPYQVYWVINDECNLKCSFCNFWKGIYHKEDRKILSISEIKTLISEFSNLKIPYLVFTGGEPFLREDMLEILEYSVSKMQHVRIQTNGTLITDKMNERIVKNRLLDELWLSLDGVGFTHDRLRGVNGAFEKVNSVLDKINYFKKKYNTSFPHVVIHTVVNKSNLNELISIIDLCIQYKAGEWFLSYFTDISENKIDATRKALHCQDFYSLQMKTGEGLSEIQYKIPDSLLRHISTARKNGLTVFVDPLLEGKISLRPRKKCILLWSSLMLSPYGEVLACPMLDKHVTGDLLEENLIDIWNNYKFKMVRKIVSYRLLPICEECCVQRRTLWAQLKAPANFKRVFLPRRLREFIYRYCKQSRKTNL